MAIKKNYIQIAEPCIIEKGDEVELSAMVTTSDNFFDPFNLWYRFPVSKISKLNTSGDPFLAAIFPIALSLSYDIHINSTISRKLLRGCLHINQIWKRWEPNLIDITIESDKVIHHFEKSQNNALFFSGGVDSFYSLIKNRKEALPADQITDLLFVRGFDLPLNRQLLYKTVLSHIKKISAYYALPLFTASTNIRLLLDRYVRWGQYGHGAAMASVGLAASKAFGKIYIAASDTYAGAWASRWGSYPLVDPLWSNNATQFIHDGNEATRSQKVFWQIADSNIAAEHLRVCWQNPGNQYNCGQCDKCVRTMINLRVAGVEKQFKTFKEPLVLSQVEGLTVNGVNRAKLSRDLSELEYLNQDHELQEVIRRFLRRKLPAEDRISAKQTIKSIDEEYLRGKIKSSYNYVSKWSGRPRPPIKFYLK